VATFEYDADGQRVKRVTPTETTIYAGLYERRTTVAGDEHTYYVASGDRGIAVVATAGTTRRTLYIHPDRNGSVDVVTDETGVVRDRQSFDAFGARRNAKWTSSAPPTKPNKWVHAGFTGHEDDPNGIVNTGARLYDPKIGRFLQPDPFVQNPLHSQSLNRYSYVENNAVSWVDPSGYSCVDVDGGKGYGAKCTPGEDKYGLEAPTTPTPAVVTSDGPPTARAVDPSSPGDHVEGTDSQATEGKGKRRDPDWMLTPEEKEVRDRAALVGLGNALVDVANAGIRSIDEANPFPTIPIHWLLKVPELTLRDEGSERKNQIAQNAHFRNRIGFMIVGTAASVVIGGLIMPGGGGRALEQAAAETAPTLPAYAGGKTAGVLRTAAGDTPLLSGYKGPSATMPRGTPGMNGNIKSHVEAHAAAIMRQQGIQEATLYINRVPCAGANGCGAMLPRMLPEGARLRVLGPDGYVKIFVGLRD